MKTFCPSCERETNCVYVAELYECKECGCDFESRQRLMQERAEEAEACDFCGGKADFSLCQTHMDAMRFLDTFSTEDGDYPEPGVMVLWCAGGDTYIGGYDPDCGWFEQGDDTHDPIHDVMWCELPSLSRMYEMMNAKGGEK